MPGSLASCCTSRAMGSAAMRRELEEAGNPESARDLAHLLLHQLLRLEDGLVDGRDDQILQHADVARVDALRVDLEAAQLEAAGHRRRDHAAARAGLDGLG